MGDLAQGIADHRAKGGKDRGFGQEQQADVAGGQAHDAVDADLAHALIHGPHHGIEHDQGGDDHGHQKLTGPAYFGGAD